MCLPFCLSLLDQQPQMQVFRLMFALFVSMATAGAHDVAGLRGLEHATLMEETGAADGNLTRMLRKKRCDPNLQCCCSSQCDGTNTNLDVEEMCSANWCIPSATATELLVILTWVGTGKFGRAYYLDHFDVFHELATQQRCVLCPRSPRQIFCLLSLSSLLLLLVVALVPTKTVTVLRGQ